MSVVVLRPITTVVRASIESGTADSPTLAPDAINPHEVLSRELQDLRMLRRVISATQRPELISRLPSLDSAIARGEQTLRSEIIIEPSRPIDEAEATQLGRVATTALLHTETVALQREQAQL